MISASKAIESTKLIQMLGSCASDSQTMNFLEIITFNEIAASLLKSIVFGILVSVVSCYHGLRRKSAMTEVPQAVSQAVIRSLLAVFVGDGIITVLVF